MDGWIGRMEWCGFRWTGRCGYCWRGVCRRVRLRQPKLRLLAAMCKAGRSEADAFYADFFDDVFAAWCGNLLRRRHRADELCATAGRRRCYADPERWRAAGIAAGCVARSEIGGFDSAGSYFSG